MASTSAQRGTPSNPTSRPTTTTSQPTTPTQTEISNPEDSFLVYLGGSETPLDGTPIWRYIQKDGLKPHSVPAVDAFRKAIAETEKAASKNP